MTQHKSYNQMKAAFNKLIADHEIKEIEEKHNNKIIDIMKKYVLTDEQLEQPKKKGTK